MQEQVATEESDCDKNRTKWDFREEREWGLVALPFVQIVHGRADLSSEAR